MPSDAGDLQRMARRASRDQSGADDLVQQAWLAALERGSELSHGALGRAWFAGTIRKLGALEARTAARRRQREAAWASTRARSPEPSSPPLSPGFIASLPRAVRSVAQLVAADLSALEIRWILGLADSAWRQRLVQLRRRWLAWPEPGGLDAAPRCQALAERRPSLVALARARKHSAFLATDPDGHVLIFCRLPLTKARPPAT